MTDIIHFSGQQVERSTTPKRIFTFDDPAIFSLGIDALGGKGAGLARLLQLGIPVPPAFVIRTEASTAFLSSGAMPAGLWDEVQTAVSWLEHKSGRRFDDEGSPLLVSVRSGAPMSLPGVLSTIKNVGANEAIADSLARSTTADFAYSTYLTLLNEYGETVLGIPTAELGNPQNGYASDLIAAIETVKDVYARHGTSMPQDPWEQLRAAISAVFESWEGKVARDARERFGIPWTAGTAVIVQMMVFGNRDARSGSGVVHTRNPETGIARLTGDFVPMAQGDAVVSGRRMVSSKDWEDLGKWPGVMKALQSHGSQLEREFGWVQDIEFTIESGQLWILQTRKGRLSPQATVRAAVELVEEEGVFKSRRDVLRHAIPMLPRLSVSRLDPTTTDKSQWIAQGIGAVAGAATGDLVPVRMHGRQTPEMAAAQAEVTARRLRKKGRQAILVTDELDNALSPVLQFVDGIVATRGGLNCHMAIQARKAQIPTIIGVNDIAIEKDRVVFGTGPITHGKVISIDGSTGGVFHGRLPITVEAGASEFSEILFDWMSELEFRFPWASAAYGELTDDELEQLRGCVPDNLNDLPWRSEKARVIETLVRIFPEESRLGMTVVAARDRAGLLEALGRAVNRGFEPGVRSCFIGRPPTGSAPWEMGLTQALAEKFVLGDPSYIAERRCKIDGTWGTYPEWLDNNLNLTELVVMHNPPGLGLGQEVSRAQHFVFNVQCNEVANKVTIELLLDTDQLRDIERLEQSQTIYISMSLDQDRPFHRGPVSYHFGKAHLRNGTPSDLCLEFWEHESQFHEERFNPKAWRVAQRVANKIFDEWWRPPFALPFRMMFLSRHDLDVIEAQGRCNDEGDVEYIRIYDCKGRDEAKKAREVEA